MRQREGAPQRRHSLRTRLLLLVATCVLPAIGASTALAIQAYRIRQEQIYNNTLLLARKVLTELDRELAGVEAGLRELATAKELVQGDLAAFQLRAQAAIKTQISDHYVLLDRQGRQVLNTLQPYGDPLPADDAPAQLQNIFVTGNRIITDLFQSPVSGRHALAMGVPVFRDSEIVYILNVGLAPERILQALQAIPLPDGWLVAVLDRNATIIARTREAPRFVGQPATEEVRRAVLERREGSMNALTKEGIPVVSSFARSPVSNWTVAVGAPKATLDAELYRQIAWVASGSLLAFGIGILLALRITRQILSSIRGLNDAALALVQGKPVTLPGINLREADAVGKAIVEASYTLAQVQHRAEHDTLTGLANRVLFDEMLQHQLELAERNGSRFAILAIDLDNFKTVNDELGHATGDRVLQGVAQRIQETLRASDIAARIGGDEFSVLLCEADAANALATAQRLVDTLSQPYPGVPFEVSASIGIAVYPDAGRMASSLLASADRLLYQVKKSGKRRVAIEQAAT